MKELSIEEKAKAYDKVSKEVKDFFEGKQKMYNDVTQTLEFLFPELKESEDERIRMQLLNWFKGCHWNAIDDGTLKRDDIITWLEKQGQQEPIFEMKTPEESLGIDSDTYSKVVDECIYGEQKPAWSEEDEENLKWFEKFFRAESVIAEGKDIPQDRYLWFKNLKDRVQPQTTWKPSGEHYELEEFAKIVRGNLTGISKAVQKLFEAKYLQLTGNKMYGGFKD